MLSVGTGLGLETDALFRNQIPFLLRFLLDCSDQGGVIVSTGLENVCGPVSATVGCTALI